MPVYMYQIVFEDLGEVASYESLQKKSFRNHLIHRKTNQRGKK